jgi:hypothetical protein
MRRKPLVGGVGIAHRGAGYQRLNESGWGAKLVVGKLLEKRPCYLGLLRQQGRDQAQERDWILFANLAECFGSVSKPLGVDRIDAEQLERRTKELGRRNNSSA